MLEKEFVLFEEALELKELGFDDKCILELWWLNGKDVTFGKRHTPTYEMNEQSSETLNFNYKIPKKHPLPKGHALTLLIPIYSQAFRWFRDKGYETFPKKTENNEYYYIIEYGHWTFIMDDKYNSYEEAELACLKKLIQIVKEKQ